MNLEEQEYKGIKLRLIDRKDYDRMRAKRFVIFNTNKNVWIPNKFLAPDGTIKTKADLRWIFDTLEMRLVVVFCKENEGNGDLTTSFSTQDKFALLRTNTEKHYKISLEVTSHENNK